MAKEEFIASINRSYSVPGPSIYLGAGVWEGQIIAEAKVERENLIKEARTVKEKIISDAKIIAEQERNKIIAEARTSIENEKAKWDVPPAF